MRGMGRGPLMRPYRPWGMRRMWIPWFPFLGLFRIVGFILLIGFIIILGIVF